MQMSNRWNKLAYRLWAPIYDGVLERLFRQGRKRAMELVDLRSGEEVTSSTFPKVSEWSAST